MANHSLVKITKRNLRIKEVREVVRETAKTHFTQPLVVGFDDTVIDGPGEWVINVEEPPENDHFGFIFWMPTRRTIEFRHPYSDWAFWAQVVFRHVLADKWNGWIYSDDTDRYRGEPSKYPSYLDWCERITSREKNEEMRAFLIQEKMKFAPKFEIEAWHASDAWGPVEVKEG